MASRKKPLGARELFGAPVEKLPASHLIAHIDGGARGNPGPAGFGVVLKDERGHRVAALSEYLGHQTNNFAEYSGLLAALAYAVEHGHKALKVISDSELLVRQLKGIYRVRDPRLREMYDRAQAMIRKLDWFRAEHVRREHNRDADRLANAAMDRGCGRVPPPPGSL
jgi:ribonuclease HI